MVDESFTDLAGDWIALLTGAFALAGIVWGAVMRATKPLHDRLDEIHSIAERLAAERERVDDLNTRVAGLERRLLAIERRLDDLFNLLVRRATRTTRDEAEDEHLPPG